MSTDMMTHTVIARARRGKGLRGRAARLRKHQLSEHRAGLRRDRRAA